VLAELVVICLPCQCVGRTGWLTPGEYVVVHCVHPRSPEPSPVRL
jgi:hypothetical protein